MRRERKALSSTQSVRASGVGSQPPSRPSAPAEQRRPVSGRLIVIGGHEDKERGRLILMAPGLGFIRDVIREKIARNEERHQQEAAHA